MISSLRRYLVSFKFLRNIVNRSEKLVQEFIFFFTLLQSWGSEVQFLPVLFSFLLSFILLFVLLFILYKIINFYCKTFYINFQILFCGSLLAYNTYGQHLVCFHALLCRLHTSAVDFHLIGSLGVLARWCFVTVISIASVLLCLWFCAYVFIQNFKHGWYLLL